LSHRVHDFFDREDFLQSENNFELTPLLSKPIPGALLECLVFGITSDAENNTIAAGQQMRRHSLDHSTRYFLASGTAIPINHRVACGRYERRMGGDHGELAALHR